MPDWKGLIEKRLDELGIAATQRNSLAEEWTAHLEQVFDEYRAQGYSSEQAARIVVAEWRRETSVEVPALPRTLRSQPAPALADPGTGDWLADLGRDLRYGVRSLMRARYFTLFAILTLALGIGANATVFTIINSVLLHPIPARDPSALVTVYAQRAEKAKSSSGGTLPLSYLNLRDLASRASAFEATAIDSPVFAATATQHNASFRVMGELVDSAYFRVLDIKPAHGRFFLPEESSRPGAAAAAILSYAAWQNKFGGSGTIVGRQVQLNGNPFTIVGVAPEGFLGVTALFGPDLWLPATMADQVLSANQKGLLYDREKNFFHGIARLKPGTSAARAQGNLQMIAGGMEREDARRNQNLKLLVRSVNDEIFGGANGPSPTLMGASVLMVVVGLVLLIACSNIANLLLARASGRSQEIAVRLALGASRSRLVRQLLTESLLLGLAGGFAGFFVGQQGCRLVWSFRPAEVADNFLPPHIDVTVVLFSFGLSLITGVLFGLAPALRSTKIDVAKPLKEHGRTVGRSRRAVNLSNILLVGQVSFSFLTLAASTLFLRSIEKAYRIDPGFEMHHLGIALIAPGRAGYDRARTEAFYRTVKENLESTPGIASAGWSSGLPFWSQPSRTVAADAGTARKKNEAKPVIALTVDENYFSAAGIRLQDGRAFQSGDGPSAAPVAIVNATLAQQLWPGKNPVGMPLWFTGEDRPRRIVGVARTVAYSSLGEAPQASVYLPLQQNFSDSMTLYLRSQCNPALALETAGMQIRRIDPKIDVNDVRTGTKLLEQVLWGPRIVMNMLGVFGLLALTLASVGLYGLLAYSVSRRTREIGLRMAMGAERSTILRLVLRQGLLLVAVGLCIGLVLSLAVGRVLSPMLFGLNPADPGSLLVASGTLIAVAFIASFLPAWAASRLDPVAALRES